MFLKVWREKAKFFHETSGYGVAKRILNERRQVIISGKPGTGKTVVATRLLLEFEKNGYSVRVLQKPEDWTNQVNIDIKQIVLIDDIFGGSTKDRDSTNCWLKFLPLIFKALKPCNMYLVMTTRSYILKSVPQYSKTSYLSKGLEINLSEKLTPDDKRGIVENTLMRLRHKGKDVQITGEEIEELILCDPPIGFPLCVKWYLSKQRYKITGIAFLKNPLDFVLNIMSNIVDEDKQTYYLLLIMLLQGEDEFNLKKKTCIRRLEEMGVEDVESTFSGVDLVEFARTLEDFYLIQTDQYSFKFVHESIQDAFWLLFGKRHFACAITIMNMDMMLDKVRIDDGDQAQIQIPTADDGEQGLMEAPIIQVEPKPWNLKVIVDRLFEELKQGNVHLVSTYTEWRNSELVSTFIARLRRIEFNNYSEQSLVRQEDKNKGGDIFYWSARQGQNILCTGLIDYIIRMELPVEHLGYILSKTLLGACAIESIVPAVSDLDLVGKLVSLKADVSFCHACLIEKERSRSNKLPDFITEISEHNSPLEAAAKQNMDDMIMFLLRSHARIKHLQWNGWEFLHSMANANAVKICNSNFIHALVKRDPALKNMLNLPRIAHDILIQLTNHCHDDMSAQERNDLFLSYIKQLPLDTEVLDGFLKFGSDICCTNENQQTALHVLISSNLDEKQLLDNLAILLQTNKEVINSLDDKHLSPLMLSIKDSKPIDVAKLLLQHGADTNIEDTYGFTALHYCVASINLKDRELSTLIEMLISNNADIKKKDKNGKTPISLAIDKGLKPGNFLYKILRKNQGEKETNLLHYVVKSEHSVEFICELIDTLLKQGENIDAKNEDGKTPLMLAVQKYPINTRLILHLLEQGAQRKVNDKNGLTALHHCILTDCNDNETVEIIETLEKGTGRFRLNSKDKTGQTPLMSCVNLQHVKTKSLHKLLALGAFPNDKDEQGKTALHHVVMSEKTDEEVMAIVKLLLDSKADINIRDKKHYKNPLMMAFSSKATRYKTIRCMAESCDLLSDLGPYERTYLHSCVMSSLSDDHSKTICEILLQKGVNINLCDKHGKYAFDYALSHVDSRIETIQVLIRKSGYLKSKNPSKILRSLMEYGKLLYEIIDVLQECSFFELQQTLHEINIFHEILEQNEPPAQFDKVVQSLRRSGFLVDARDENGNSALLKACMKDTSQNIINVLLKEGADTNIQNTEGKTALHLCITSSRSDREVCSIIENLLTNVDNVNVEDGSGLTPLHDAIRIPLNRMNTIYTLLQKGACVASNDRNGNNAIHHCLSLDRTDYDASLILEMLLKHSDTAALNHRNKMGLTPLNLAASCSNCSRISCIIQLLESNCIKDTVDGSDRSPFINSIYCLDGYDILIRLERCVRVSIFLAYGCFPDDTKLRTLYSEKKYEDVKNILNEEQRSQEAMAHTIKSITGMIMQHFKPDSTSWKEIASDNLTSDLKLSVKSASRFLLKAKFDTLEGVDVGSDFINDDND